MEKITNRKALEYAIKHLTNLQENSDPDAIDGNMIAKLQAMVDAIDKKNSAPRKPTTKQIENEGLKENILNLLRDNSNQIFSCSEIVKKLGIEGLSIQRVSALLRSLVEQKLVEKFTEKRKTYFRIVK